MAGDGHREQREAVDVVIVGSGAAGSVLAARLAGAGKRVVILEAGPERRMKDLISSQIWARRLKWGGPPVIEKGAQPIGHAFNAGWGTGGAALHHYGVWLRLHPEDFEVRSRFDRGLDWPIDYDQLRPYYDRIQAEVGISGDAEAEIWRPPGAPYPMGPVPRFAQGRVLARGFAAEGLRVAPVPLALNTQVYKDRPACLWDGWCDAGCPIGALGNPLAIYLPQALAAGAEIRHRAMVTRVLTDKKGERARGVEYVDSDGVRRVQPASVVVLAAFAVQTPRILLNSASPRHPRGLANSSGLVGAYVMTHPAGGINGLFDEDTECFYGASGGQLVCQDGYVKDSHGKEAFGSYQWLAAQAVKPNDLLGFAVGRPDVYGPALDDLMTRARRGFASMTSVSEDLPVRANRVRLSTKKDEFGLPLAEVVHNTAPESLALWRRTLAEGKRVFKAAGAKQVWTGPIAPMHIIGGTIMGKDPETSVTDSYGRAHDLANLFLAGTGLFPTSGGVNPTFTVHALALRTAEHMIEHWGTLTL